MILLAFYFFLLVLSYNAYSTRDLSSSFSDPESETLTYSLTSSSSFSKYTFNSTTGVLIISSTNNSDVGNHLFNVTATDGHSDTTDASETFYINITEDLGWQINNAVTDKSYRAHANTSFSTDVSGTDTFIDSQGDDISRTGYDISPSQSFMTINSALDSLTITNPGNSDVGNYTISIYWKDNHTDTGFANLSFTVEITENVGCQVSSTPTSQSYTAHMNTTLVTAGIGMFSDPNGEAISISGHSFSPSNSFLSLSSDNTTVTISDPGNADIGNYTVSIFWVDPYSDTGVANNSFVIEITENQGCQVATQITNQSFVAHKVNTVTMNGISMFSDPESQSISLSGSGITPSNAFMSINSDGTLVTISNPANANVGNYTVYLLWKDPYSDTSVGNMSFNIEITEDLGCQVSNAPSNRSFVAHTNTTVNTDTVGVDTFIDSEGDDISRTGYDITPSQTFMTINSALDSISISDPANSDVGTYTVSIYCKDNHTDTGFANLTFTIEITENIGCQISSTPSNQTYVAHTNTTFITSGIGLFSDPNSDPISIIGHSFTPSASFLTLSSDNTTITISNPLNSNVGNYTFILQCKDPYSDTGVANNTFVIEITENQGCQIANQINNQTFIAHTNTTITISGSSIFSDIEGDTLFYIGSGISPSSSFLSIDSGHSLLTISDPQNSDLGTHTVHVICKDQYSDTGTTNMSFTVEIVENVGWQVSSTFNNVSYAAHTNTSITTLGIGHFSDPTGESISVTSHSISPSNSFLTLNSDNMTFTLSDPGNANVGNYTVSLYCEDLHSDTGTANMSFTLEIYENVACRIANQVANQTFVAHTNHSFLFGSIPIFDDPEGDTIAHTGYSIVPNASFITHVANFEDYDVANPLNANVGNYSWTIFWDDNYVSFSFW